MTAAACCTSTPIIYQIQIISTKSQRSQFTPIITRTSLPTSNGSIISISEIRRPIKLKDTIKNDLNNNKNDHEVTKISNQEARDLTSNDDTPTNINEEDFLALVGLRRKTKISSKRPPTLRPLAKRLAAPVCLLPLPKYGQRVRQALNILLPFLKFLSIIQDIELFCSTNDHARNECLLTRSVTQTRTSKPMSKKANKRKVSKSGNVPIERQGTPVEQFDGCHRSIMTALFPKLNSMQIPSTISLTLCLMRNFKMNDYQLSFFDQYQLFIISINSVFLTDVYKVVYNLSPFFFRQIYPFRLHDQMFYACDKSMAAN